MTTSPQSTSNDNGWFALLVVAALGAGAYFLFVHGHPPTAEELAGEWRATDKPWSIRFTPDGQIAMRTIGPMKNGTYFLDDEGTLKVHLQDGRKFQAKLKLRGQKLDMTDPDGTTSTFTKGQASRSM